MSWDVMIMKFDQAYESLSEIPDNATSLPLGSRADVHASVTAFFPGTNWSDAAWGTFDSPIGSVEFNLGSSDPADSMMLHVRAATEIVAPIVAMCRQYDWNAVDCSTGELLERSDDPVKGIEGWHAFRNEVLRRKSEE